MLFRKAFILSLLTLSIAGCVKEDPVVDSGDSNIDSGSDVESGSATSGSQTSSAPSSILLSNNAVAENAAAGELVATLSAIDVDPDESFSYRIVNDPDNLFTLQGDQLKVARSGAFNYELSSSHVVLLSVTDSTGNEFQKPASIDVVDVNESPTDIVMSGGSIAEGAASGSVVATLSAVDEDRGDRFRYQLLSGGDGNFEIANSEIKLSAAAALDYTLTDRYTLQVSVEDLAKNRFEKVLTITVDPAVPADASSWYKPSSDTTWQWQLQGTVNSSYSAQLYDIDLFDSSEKLISGIKAEGKRVICYFSGGSYENWRPDVDQFVDADLGSNLDGWPGERWLNIRSSNVLKIMQGRLDLAKQKGCDGVEPDNMDGYSNSNGLGLTANDQLQYNRALAEEAHKRGLSVGLKNDLDQVSALQASFDFAINEQCHQYSECDMLLPFIDAGKPVFNAEYATKYVNNQTDRDSLCSQAVNLGLHTLVLPLDLDDSFRFSCD